MFGRRKETPFQVHTEAPNPPTLHNVEASEDDDQLSLEELESAYLRALEASDVAEAAIGDELETEGAPESIAEFDAPEVVSDKGNNHASAATEPADETTVGARVTQQSVLEALLFVGGASLTTRKLAEILNLRDPDAVEPLVTQLNQQYAQQRRPYIVGFHEGGYRLELTSEFEGVRRKVYGLAPKEVRLSQEALEILALVAYRQPLSDQDLRLTDRKNALPLVRQLLRRELVALQRDDENPKQVSYITTPRFLQLFGIGSLDDLPYPEDLEFK